MLSLLNLFITFFKIGILTFGGGYAMIPMIIEETSSFSNIDSSEIIDFILEDHEFIKNISLYSNSFELDFAINWTDKSIKGIKCGDIGLTFKFNDNIELEKQYLYLLFQNLDSL